MTTPIRATANQKPGLWTTDDHVGRFVQFLKEEWMGEDRNYYLSSYGITLKVRGNEVHVCVDDTTVRTHTVNDYVRHWDSGQRDPLALHLAR